MVQKLNSFWRIEGDRWEITLPDCPLSLPAHYYSEGDCQGCFVYRLCFDDLCPEKESKKLVFEGAMLKLKVSLNGKELGERISGFLPVEYDVTGLVKRKGNELIAEVDGFEDSAIPPFGNVVDYLTYAGLYREVKLVSHNKRHLEDIFVSASASGEMHIQAKDENGDLVSDLRGTLYLGEREIGSFEGSEAFFEGISPYSHLHPTLYRLKIVFNDEEYDLDVGFRDVEWKEDGFYLNGKKTKLFGLNRHQSFPYLGMAAAKGLQEEDARKIKELGLNVVRTSHYPQSEHFLNACDCLGLFVIDEIPGWQHIGDKAWQDKSAEMARGMIKKERNHPCLIAYGLRIDESPDSHDYYSRLEKIKNELDPSRASIGVRNFKGSELLEDIYGYNDFSCSCLNHGLDDPKTYGEKGHARLVTEHNGHMFPTKMGDRDQRAAEHALRHLKVIDDAIKFESLAGEIGWCAFDYGTHRDFGSGDHICYHGVFSQFRVKKAAAYAIESQFASADVAYIPYSLELGDYSESKLPSPLPIFANADSVRFYRGEDLIGEFLPNRKLFPHLPHPPVFIDSYISESALPPFLKGRMRKWVAKAFNYAAINGLNKLKLRHKLLLFYLMKRHRLSYSEVADIFTRAAGLWGAEKKGFRFEFYRGGNLVNVLTRGPFHYQKLEVSQSSSTLPIGDQAAVYLNKTDDHGNPLKYDYSVVEVKAMGDIELCSPALFSLEAGQSAIYVRGKEGKAGSGSLLIKCGQLETNVSFKIEKAED